MDGDGLLVFTNEYSFVGGESGYNGGGFLCWDILDNICGVAKRRVHGVGGREKMVVGFFKTEGGGFHVMRNRFSIKNIIRLGSC